MSLSMIQIGSNTSDLPGTLLLYSEAFGFENAGGNVLARQVIRIQGLGEEARSLIWWMVGGNGLFQLEFFHHTNPPQRPRRADWNVVDHGWGRIGIAVPDFDRALVQLARSGAHVIAGIVTVEGARRAAVKDPYIGIVLEILEDGPALRREFGDMTLPLVAYAAASVSDLESARLFYRDQIGLTIAELDEPPEREALWGLEDATRRGFVALAPGGGPRMKIVEYLHPKGRPRPADYRASDQGIVNVAFGSNDKADAAAAWARLDASGYTAPMLIENDLMLACYITDPDREVEIATIPDDLAGQLGFKPAGSFIVSTG